jgi:sporulation protein YlmC with PRC-barrel domain
MMRHLLIAAAIAGVSGIAQAQQTVPALIEVENEAMVVAPFQMTVDELDDLDVYGVGGEKIGEIEEVLMTPEGEIVAVAIEVGGFLGIGEKDVIVMLDQISMEGDRLVMDATEDQLAALPEWDD